jgi:hypothetical protein
MRYPTIETATGCNLQLRDPRVVFGISRVSLPKNAEYESHFSAGLRVEHRCSHLRLVAVAPTRHRACGLLQPVLRPPHHLSNCSIATQTVPTEKGPLSPLPQTERWLCKAANERPGLRPGSFRVTPLFLVVRSFLRPPRHVPFGSTS